MERVFHLDAKGARVAVDKRDPGKRYKFVVGGDGAAYVALSDAENLQRDAEEAAHAASLNVAPEPTAEEIALEALRAKLTEVEMSAARERLVASARATSKLRPAS